MRLIPPLLSAIALTAVPALVFAPAAAQAQLFIGIQIGIAPPALPIYEQPPLPGPDYVWIPGYWSWDDDYGDYFWVPGTWVLAPSPGYLWTPAWWGWDNGLYVFHDGYWGQHVGFYGGVNYGFGYNGSGYEGGYWNGGHFFYNTAVNRITNVNITNVYQKTVIVEQNTHVSFSGGPGGVRAQPTPAQSAAAREPHLQPTVAQTQQVQAAHSDRTLFASSNHGAPPVAASAAPGRLTGPGVVQAKSAGGPLPQALSRGPVGPHAAGPSSHFAAAPSATPSASPGARYEGQSAQGRPAPQGELQRSVPPVQARPPAPFPAGAPQQQARPAYPQAPSAVRPFNAPTPQAPAHPQTVRPPQPPAARPAPPPAPKAPPHPPEDHKDEHKAR